MSIADKITSTLVNSNISSALQTSSVNDTLSGDNTAVTSYSSMSETPPLCGCSLCRGDKAENMLEDGQQTDSAYMIDGPQYASTYYTRGIDSGYEWTGTSGGKTVINYKFWDSLPGYYSSSSSESNNFQPFTSSQKAAALKSLICWKASPMLISERSAAKAVLISVSRRLISAPVSEPGPIIRDRPASRATSGRTTITRRQNRSAKAVTAFCCCCMKSAMPWG